MKTLVIITLTAIALAELCRARPFAAIGDDTEETPAANAIPVDFSGPAESSDNIPDDDGHTIAMEIAKLYVNRLDQEGEEGEAPAIELGDIRKERGDFAFHLVDGEEEDVASALGKLEEEVGEEKFLGWILAIFGGIVTTIFTTIWDY